ncbi:MAG: hypothetical protein K0S45_1751 [Nitrospira sp.]|nr:hypothetical protein [Nitrospira sp.]
MPIENYESYASLLALAGIHATILSIIAAAVGISFSLINGKKVEILGNVFDDQRRIENMFPIGDARFVPLKDPELNTDNDTVRAKVLSEFPKVAYGPNCLDNEECPSQADLGEKAFLSLVSLVHHYPRKLPVN